MEKGCKWYFGPEGGAENGPTSPSKGTFRFHPDISIVREAIQNSLDVPAGEEPVEIRFSFSKMKSSDFPNFFGIREHIIESLRYYNYTDRAREKFPSMISYLSADGNGQNAGYAESIDVLTISDFKTTGMWYEKGNRQCPFHAFFHSIGVSVGKGENSGGSNGLGKETLYNRSKIKTLLLCSRSNKGGIVFQGATKLTTHLDPNDQTQRVTPFGYYGVDRDEPVTDDDHIPDCFKRTEIGTDVHVIGIDLSDRDNVRNSIVKAVLNHFWLAVYRRKLVVNVDGVDISKETLGRLIDLHFKDNRETKTDNYDKWNPRPYYNAVLNVEAGLEKTVLEQQDLPTLGHVKMYVDWSSDDLPKRIAYMRVPRMVIFKKPRKTLPSFVAVFVCDNDSGNRVLRCVEPPAHDEWALDYYEGADEEKHKQGIKEVDDFVRDTLEKYLKPKASHNEIIIPGLAELLPDTDDESTGGEKGTVGSGSAEGLQPSGHLAREETAAPYSYIAKDDNHAPSVPTTTCGGTAAGIVEDMAPSDDGEPAVLSGGGPNESDGGDRPGNDPTTVQNPVPAAIAPQPGAATQVRIPVAFTPITVKRDGALWHKLIVRPARTGKLSAYSDVTLFIKTGSDNGGKDDSTEIERIIGLPAGANLNGSRISGLDMRNGVKFEVLFADSIMHSIKVVAYAGK